MTNTLTLPYGLSEAVPENADVAWGARFIVTQDGHVDLPPDRQGTAGGGDRTALLDAMQGVMPFGRLRQEIADRLCSGEINTREQAQHVLADDDGILIVADTKASAGYLYVAAFHTQVVAV
jgi:hypothetical protein